MSRSDIMLSWPWETLARRRRKSSPGSSGSLKTYKNYVRDPIWKYLETLGPEAKEAVPLLVADFNGGYPPERRVLIARTLGSIGPAAKETVPTLVKFLKDEEEQAVRNGGRSRRP